jgi:hypothetical protein
MKAVYDFIGKPDKPVYVIDVFSMFGCQHPGSQRKRCTVALGDQFTALVGNGVKMSFQFILDIVLTYSKANKKQEIKIGLYKNRSFQEFLLEGINRFEKVNIFG